MSENTQPKRKKSSTRRRFIGLAATGIAGTALAGVGATAFGSGATYCETFPSKLVLELRRKTIATILATTDPAKTAAWITGTGQAPAAVKAETDRQVPCLARAAANGTGTDPDTAVVSWFRDARTQRTIWDRKYDFLRTNEGGAGPFGLITDGIRRRYAGKLGSATQWDPDNEAHREVWASLTPEQRQIEILQTSAAPGVSRHHLGSEVDLFSTTPSDWSDNGPMAAQFAWLNQNAARHGFFRPYTAGSAKLVPAYEEERWHWSYYPVSEAVVGFIRTHSSDIAAQLDKLWSYDPARYTYIRKNWQNYVFHVNETIR